ncbi:cadherin-related [Schistosoma mansoni]|uniref:cadherin-related n=1 Tax=Schistosoma mansoni TaxID=6183 RepID=UPI00022DC350|nr:cadherin-related [Schistosoma mansoni]|eukprot:XP_018650582.1 cadherin-related [Schistosoma mansoni]
MIIDVLNINDNEPKFSQMIYEIKIMENILVNSMIYQLIATDEDVNSTITYSMVNNIDLNLTSKFLIQSNGQIIIKEQLDYEQCNLYSYTIRANDGEFDAFTQLIIKIIDVNDERPEFLLNPSKLIIKENQPEKTFIGHLLIIDRDSPQVNGQVHCEEPSHLIRNQPILFVKESFDLNERIFQNKYDRENITDKYLAILYCWDGIPNSFSNSLVSLDSTNYLSTDYPKHVSSMTSMSLLSSLTATMTITLQILDENDNEPIFDKPLYKVTFKENSPRNTKIIQMHATDKDIEENAQIYYSLQKNELNTPYFKIDPITGWILNTAEIDREAQSTFKLTILAIDGGYQPLNNQFYLLSNNNTIHHTSTTQLIIHMLDVNDNAPEFYGPRQFAIEENQPSNTWIGDLKVIDKDEGLNSEITLKLLLFSDKWFNENSHYCFEVIASDNGQDKVYSTIDTICIRILDLNDNKPYFIGIEGEYHDHYKKLFIVNDCSTIDYIKNDLIPYYGFVETDTYCNGTNTNDQSTCIMNMNANGQELAMNNEIQPVYVERVLLPLNINKNTFQQPEWNSFILEFPQNDCQHILLNTSFDDKHLRCSLHLPQQLNHNTQLCDSSKMSFPSVSLPSSNNSTVKPDLILLQCTNTLPISSSNYVQHHRSVLLNPTSMSNTVILLDPNTPSLKNPKSVNKRNIDCSVQNIITPIASEEQHSDSGRGASDEENSSRIHQH